MSLRIDAYRIDAEAVIGIEMNATSLGEFLRSRDVDQVELRKMDIESAEYEVCGDDLDNTVPIMN